MKRKRCGFGKKETFLRKALEQGAGKNILCFFVQEMQGISL